MADASDDDYVLNEEDVFAVDDAGDSSDSSDGSDNDTAALPSMPESFGGDADACAEPGERDTTTLRERLRLALERRRATDSPLSFRVLAELYGVAPSTLHRHYTSLTPVGPVGRPLRLHSHDEEALAQWCQQRADACVPVTVQQLRAAAGRLASARDRPFKQGTASRRWAKDFLARKGDVLRVTTAKEVSTALPTADQWATYFACYEVRISFLRSYTHFTFNSDVICVL